MKEILNRSSILLHFFAMISYLQSDQPLNILDLFEALHYGS
jgi:hypothetical protein